MELFRTAVNQAPHGGSVYPFAGRDSASPLVLDLYLSYQDAATAFAYPFRLAWFFGGGTVPSDPPEDAPTPVHDRDLLIVDADDRVVFDSTEADTFHSTDWGDRRRVLEWKAGDSVCRLVYDHTVAGDFDEDTVPSPGLLDSRTCNRLPRRVRSLRVSDQELQGRVRLQAGYNVRLKQAEASRRDGGRFRSTFDLDCAPGLGLGRSPGCNDELPVLRSINGQAAGPGGNLFLDADDCASVRLVVEAGAYGGSGLAEDEARSALLLDDDCTPCCPCDYFVRTYKGLRRVHSRWAEATQELESIRDLYQDNRARWLVQRDCRISNALKVNAVAEAGCTLAFALSYCNTTFGCVHPVEIRLNVELYDDGVLVEPADDAFVCAQAYINDSSRVAEEPFVMTGTWPSFGAVFPYLSPQSSGTLRFRLCLQGCADTMSLSLTLSAHSPDPEAAYGGDDVAIPDLGAGDAYGSAYTTRGVVELTRPLLSGTAEAGCGCS